MGPARLGTFMRGVLAPYFRHTADGVAHVIPTLRCHIPESTWIACRGGKRSPLPPSKPHPTLSGSEPASTARPTSTVPTLSVRASNSRFPKDPKSARLIEKEENAWMHSMDEFFCENHQKEEPDRGVYHDGIRLATDS
ncbi:unnamed protein product [Darwinula stevensoni]|uniref:Uncharacterized protein n=1 Tax=Darwinula stevensoni TaxID=69355 RepID=A0A7R8ZZ24_9CRUS|nr:unnamed protein product [Darwinula stevensoni]CAG0881673.1 unnamed protein product [Darwinula stevensoni]